MKTLLLVDDNCDYLQLLSSLLKKDFQIYTATGMAEALKIVDTIPVNAVCSDFSMPDGTGITLLEQLRNKNINIPFLLMSGYNDRFLFDAAVRYGAVFCCKTDFDLLEKIRKLCSP